MKYFIDSTVDGFKTNSAFAPFLAWAQQFIVLCKECQVELKCLNSKLNLEKDIRQKINKKETIESILEQFDREAFITFLENEAVGEEERVRQY